MSSYRQNIKQELLRQIEILSERKLQEVLDFAKFLSYRERPFDETKAEYQKSQREILASLNQIRETGRQMYGVYQDDLVTISLDISNDLARRLTPLWDHLPEIIKLGLYYWQDVEATPLTPRQHVEHIWDAAGLVVPLDPTISHRYPQPLSEQSPVQAGGKPASQIIIEQRGEL